MPLTALDLQLRLDTSQGEVQKLREDLRLKEERVNALEERLRVMEEERKLREQMLTLDPVHDIQLIRDYKMRQQYLAQLQHVAQCVPGCVRLLPHCVQAALWLAARLVVAIVHDDAHGAGAQPELGHALLARP